MFVPERRPCCETHEPRGPGANLPESAAFGDELGWFEDKSGGSEEKSAGGESEAKLAAAAASMREPVLA